MNMAFKSAILISLFVIIATPAVVRAETLFVSDELVITMRAGEGSEYKIIDYLKAGTSLRVLQKEGDYVKVRTPEGKEGWVLKRYATPEPPKAAVIAELRKEIEGMKAAMGDTENIMAERDSLREENVRLAAKAEKLEYELRSIERKELLYWFLAGAGVLFLGWLIGRSSRKKRYY